MLRFITIGRLHRLPRTRISIHLMLRFIVMGQKNSAVNVNFNTSHVTVYLLFSFNTSNSSTYFNTSHVTVYRTVFLAPGIFPLHFNTSHVTVYLTIEEHEKQVIKFQYISCYGLSQSFYGRIRDYVISIHLMLRFIRITSYPSFLCWDFNTSHVTVYPYQPHQSEPV